MAIASYLPFQNSKFLKQVDKTLYDVEICNNVCTKIENKSGIKREYLVRALLLIIGIYVTIFVTSRLIASLVGYYYPSVECLRALENNDSKAVRRWLIYWITFSSFVVFESITRSILVYLPFYDLVKAAFLVYLMHPSTEGSTTIYIACVKPLFEMQERQITMLRRDSDINHLQALVDKNLNVEKLLDEQRAARTLEKIRRSQLALGVDDDTVSETGDLEQRSLEIVNDSLLDISQKVLESKQD